MILALIYLGICLAVGLIGKEKKFGFWGYFFGSIVLTPIIGLLLVLASDPTKSEVSRRLDELATEKSAVSQQLEELAKELQKIRAKSESNPP